MKILIVEDDREIRYLIQETLEEEGFQCQAIDNGAIALEAVKRYQPELILLDRMLPGLDGLEICCRIRQNRQIKDPYIIMLTAKGEEVDRIVGLSTGADDYVVKPFSPSELVARVRAVLRRSLRQVEPSQVFQTQHFQLDKDQRIVSRQLDEQSPEELDLTAIEFDLMTTFLSQPNRVWTRPQLIEKLWGDDFFGDERVVDTHVGRLRKKVEPQSKPTFIKTVTGVGYKFEDGHA